MVGGTDGRGERDSGLVVGGVGAACGRVLVPACEQLARVGAIEKVE